MKELLTMPVLGLALMSAGGVIVYQLKAIPAMLWQKISTRIYFTTSVSMINYTLYTALNRYLRKNHYAKFSSTNAKLDDNNQVQIQQDSGFFTIKHNGKKILITADKHEKKGGTFGSEDVFIYSYTLRAFKGREALVDFLNMVVYEYLGETNKQGITISTNTTHGEWCQFGVLPVKSIDQIVIREDLKKQIVEDVEKFENNRDWYMSTNIRYKRGYCFYGPPGTGKTSISLALAAKLNRRVYMLNLKHLKDDQTLISSFADLRENSIVLLEDLDVLFDGRKSIEHAVSFSALLNCLDGALYKSGSIIVITANDITKLDPALLRAGRVDLSIEIGNPGPREIAEYLNIFYKPDEPVKAETFDGISHSMSYVQEVCIQNKDFSVHTAINKLLER